jgi:hypothetical protein
MVAALWVVNIEAMLRTDAPNNDAELAAITIIVLRVPGNEGAN